MQGYAFKTTVLTLFLFAATLSSSLSFSHASSCMGCHQGDVASAEETTNNNLGTPDQIKTVAQHDNEKEEIPI